MSTRDSYAALQAIADFDHPFTVTGTGELTDAPAGIYAPEVYHDETSDITDTGPWEALTGYTGQYSYNGAVMHSSEYLGGGLAADVLKTPGTYVVTVVNVLPEDVCHHCERAIVQDSDGRWIDPEATGDDSIWRETCDRHDTFTAEHERDDSPEPAGWTILRLRDVV